MSEYDGLNVGFSGERKPLPANSYGSSAAPGLEIVSYIGAKPASTDSDLKIHSLLVASLDSVEGTAFLQIKLKDLWLTADAIGVAFNNNKLGSEQGRGLVEGFWHREAQQKVEAANTPPERVEEAAAIAYDNILTQVKINVGSLFRLQDWAGKPRDPGQHPSSLVGVQFSGTVRPGVTATAAEVKSVYSRKKQPVVVAEIGSI